MTILYRATVPRYHIAPSSHTDGAHVGKAAYWQIESGVWARLHGRLVRTVYVAGVVVERSSMGRAARTHSQT